MNSEIWAIGGGKGGTGKSFLTSNMGMKLAQQGKRVTLIDADLGGANLHTFLKMRKPKFSLTDFFEKKIPLSEIIHETDNHNLRFITGDIRSLDSSSANYAMKLKLYRHIKNISADYVLIDLGAGSSNDTIDTFLLADKMIVVILPEETSIDNLYLFIKKVLFRKLNHLLAERGLRSVAKEAWENRDKKSINNIRELFEYIKNTSPEIRALVEDSLSHFTIHIIMNQVKNQHHIDTGFEIRSVISKFFGIDAKYMGYIRYNEFFWKFVKESCTKQIIPAASTSEEVGIVVKNILENKHLKFSDVGNLIN